MIGSEPGRLVETALYFADSGYDLGLTDTYLSSDVKVNNTAIEQHLFEVSANGQVHEGWGAGAVMAAVGASYREEEIVQIVQDVTNPASDHSGDFRPVSCDDDDIGLRGVSTPDCLNTVGIQYSKVSNIKGKIDVKEVFGEVLLPLLADRPYMALMSLDLAARWADYSGSGDVWAWKAGLDAQITDDFRFRSTYSRDVRAANLSERFDKTGGTTTVDDPEFGGENYNVTIFSGGNPNVAPEEADTITAGLVYQPSFLDGLSMSLDWYEVEIDGAIGQLGTQAVVNQCFAGAQNLCALITRNPDNNRLVLVGDVFINIDQRVVRGLDLELGYRTDLDLFGDGVESLQARLLASHLSEASEINAGAAKIDRVGQTGLQQSDGEAYGLPDFKLTANVSYNYGDFSAFLQGRYIGSGTQENALVEGVSIEDNSVDSVFYADLNLSYGQDMRRGGRWEIFGNITNMFDEEPPVTAYFNVFLGYSQQSNPGLFDVLGRRFTAGMRVSF